MTEIELKKFHLAMIDIWEAFKPRITQVSNKDAYWDDVMRAFDKVTTKYKGTIAEDFAMEMSVAAVKSLENQYRKAAGL